MARVFLIIDGDNLLHAAGYGRARYGPGQLAAQRRRLVLDLRDRIDPLVWRDTIVVFDGREVDGLADHADVRYSGADSDADSVIELLLRQHSSPRQVLVVSSDHRLQQAAARRGATSIDSDRFWNRLDDLPASPASESAGPDHSATRTIQSAHVPAEDLQQFLDIDVDAIARAIQRETRSARKRPH